MAVQQQVSYDNFLASLANKVSRLDAILGDIAEVDAWLDGVSDADLVTYFGGSISEQDANDIKSIIGVIMAAKTAFESHGNISLVRRAVGPGAML